MRKKTDVFRKKVLKPSQRVEMAKCAIANRGLSIRQACKCFSVSEGCYRYTPTKSQDDELIADCLISLVAEEKNWGFGLCFLHLRNVKGFSWNHKRVYRIYRELELNLRIKPKKRLVREKLDVLRVFKILCQ